VGLLRRVGLLIVFLRGSGVCGCCRWVLSGLFGMLRMHLDCFGFVVVVEVDLMLC